MAKSKKSKKIEPYVCQNCQTRYLQWQGQCSECQAWNQIEEELAPQARASSGPVLFRDLPKIEDQGEESTHIDFLDRLLGGGLPSGTAVLLGGEPGIGKSTLLFQMMKATSGRVLYVSAEESVRQIAMRFKDGPPREDQQFYFYPENRSSEILKEIRKSRPRIVVIDSIQMIIPDDEQKARGGVAALRETASDLIDTCKGLGITLWIVGHVNKEGEIAGPKVLEHLVDTVLTFSLAKESHLRLLQVGKHRFGRSGEIALLEMSSAGLSENKQSDAYWVQQHAGAVAGCVLAAVMMGSRPLGVEVQALVAPSYLASPRRSTSGFDMNRLHLLLAVMEKKLKLPFSRLDVYLNIVGGMKVSDPGMDFAVAVALASAHWERPVALDSIFCGEVGLTGELREVVAMPERFRYAALTGKKVFCCAPWKMGHALSDESGVTPLSFSRLEEAFSSLFPGPRRENVAVSEC